MLNHLEGLMPGHKRSLLYNLNQGLCRLIQETARWLGKLVEESMCIACDKTVEEEFNFCVNILRYHVSRKNHLRHR